MAETSNYKRLTIETIKENLIAIQYCFDFNKQTSSEWDGNELGMLGMPALILLSSVIDTIGSYFLGCDMEIMVDDVARKIERVADHFLILNHRQLFNLSLSNKTITDFYSNYRSIATHNNTLPGYHFLDIGSNEDEIFALNEDNSIKLVRLKPLFNAINNVVNTFFYYVEHGNWSETHKLSQRIEEQSNPIFEKPDSITITGNTQTQR